MSTTNLDAVMKNIRNSGLAEYVEPDRVVGPFATPNDELYLSQQ